MAGRAVIHLKFSEPVLAKASIAAALIIHPFLPQRLLFRSLVRNQKVDTKM